MLWCGRWDLNPQGSNIHRSLRPARLPVPPHPHIKFMLVYNNILAEKSQCKANKTPQVFGLWGFYLFFCYAHFFYWCFGNCFKFFLFLILFIFCYEFVAGCDKSRKNKQDKKYCRKCTN